uniref:Uncharacterized protein n=1 Tax=Picea glauca TaxID=3330 RepID=A0A101LZX9_PICGL|nr:hypothetical protein ABT39_MTgene4432 [Picea glauca]QHR88826.1 hypothetical protein Q903MT_gene2845 [Picea sitchensis]
MGANMKKKYSLIHYFSSLHTLQPLIIFPLLLLLLFPTSLSAMEK